MKRNIWVRGLSSFSSQLCIFSIKPESYKTKSISCDHYVQKTNTVTPFHHGNPDKYHIINIISSQCQWNITLPGVTSDKSILTICIVKYDILLHDMMEFLRLMSDGLVKTGTTKFIKHIFTKVLLHKQVWKTKSRIPLLDKPGVLQIFSLDST